MVLNKVSIKVSVDSYWIRFGVPSQSSSFTGDCGGKYLFFSTDQQTLQDICEYEISNHGFEVAKVSTEPSNSDYVCCLYWSDDTRKQELSSRYRCREDIKYRYWKSNADTIARKYSKQHIQNNGII